MPPPITTETAVRRYVRAALAEVRARQTSCKPPTNQLRDVIAEWFNSLPVISRIRRFSMTEISTAIEGITSHRYQWQQIATALESLGWVSGRDWTKVGRNRRFWHPPQL